MVGTLERIQPTKRRRDWELQEFASQLKADFAAQTHPTLPKTNPYVQSPCQLLLVAFAGILRGQHGHLLLLLDDFQLTLLSGLSEHNKAIIR